MLRIGTLTVPSSGDEPAMPYSESDLLTIRPAQPYLAVENNNMTYGNDSHRVIIHVRVTTMRCRRLGVD
jgi:hypothetical protein